MAVMRNAGMRECREHGADGGAVTPDSRLPILDSRLPTPDSRLTILRRNDRVDLLHELLDAQRLGEVVVHPRGEAALAIAGHRIGGQRDD